MGVRAIQMTSLEPTKTREDSQVQEYALGDTVMEEVDPGQEERREKDSRPRSPAGEGSTGREQ